MPLTLNFGTSVAKDKAERLATALSDAAGVGFLVQSAGFFSSLFEIVSVVPLVTDAGSIQVKATQPDGGTFVIPDDILRHITAERVVTFKNKLKELGVVLINLETKPEDWYATTNLRGGRRRGRAGPKTRKNRMSRKSRR